MSKKETTKKGKLPVEQEDAVVLPPYPAKKNAPPPPSPGRDSPMCTPVKPGHILIGAVQLPLRPHVFGPIIPALPFRFPGSPPSKRAGSTVISIDGSREVSPCSTASASPAGKIKSLNPKAPVFATPASFPSSRAASVGTHSRSGSGGSIIELKAGAKLGGKDLPAMIPEFVPMSVANSLCGDEYLEETGSTGLAEMYEEDPFADGLQNVPEFPLHSQNLFPSAIRASKRFPLLTGEPPYMPNLPVFGGLQAVADQSNMSTDPTSRKKNKKPKGLPKKPSQHKQSVQHAHSAYSTTPVLTAQESNLPPKPSGRGKMAYQHNEPKFNTKWEAKGNHYHAQVPQYNRDNNNQQPDSQSRPQCHYGGGPPRRHQPNRYAPGMYTPQPPAYLQRLTEHAAPPESQFVHAQFSPTVPPQFDGTYMRVPPPSPAQSHVLPDAFHQQAAPWINIQTPNGTRTCQIPPTPEPRYPVQYGNAVYHIAHPHGYQAPPYFHAGLYLYYQLPSHMQDRPTSILDHPLVLPQFDPTFPVGYINPVYVYRSSTPEPAPVSPKVELSPRATESPVILDGDRYIEQMQEMTLGVDPLVLGGHRAGNEGSFEWADDVEDEAQLQPQPIGPFAPMADVNEIPISLDETTGDLAAAYSPMGNLTNLSGNTTPSISVVNTDSLPIALPKKKKKSKSKKRKAAAQAGESSTATSVAQTPISGSFPSPDFPPLPASQKDAGAKDKKEGGPMFGDELPKITWYK